MHSNVNRTHETTRKLVHAVTLENCLPKRQVRISAVAPAVVPAVLLVFVSLHRRETSNNTQNYAVTTHKSFRNYYSQITQTFDTAGHN